VSSEPRNPESRAARLGWLVAPLLLAAVAVSVLVVRGHPELLVGAALVVLFGLVFGWVAVSIFSPAVPDKDCPRCGDARIEPLEADSTQGIRCSGCGFVDPTASSFYLAEEKGTLARIVARQRRRRAPEAPH
jgi:hypothetical protein